MRSLGSPIGPRTAGWLVPLALIVLLLLGAEADLGPGTRGGEGESAPGAREAAGGPQGAGAGADGGSAEARVVRSVDGDTIAVEIAGREERVRYIGVDTPESVKPGEPVECFGKEAAELNRELVEGRRVRLVFDRERRDRYGRLLAYVHAGGVHVNAELVRRGAARTLEIAPNTSFAERFERLSIAAARAGRGLWGAC